jgi:rubrerythrin
MAYNFNADEILRVAEQIERNGADFYNRLASKTADPEMNRFFLDLASMEREHEKVFSSMKSNLSDQERAAVIFDPEDESSQYLQALAEISVIDDKARDAFALAEGASGKEGVTKALRAAIDLEKDSVVFYLGLKELVPRHLGKDRVDEIIREEMTHIRLLAGKLTSLKR